MITQTKFKNYYPTPKNVIRKLIEKLKFNNDNCNIRILEPSAGKGHILKELEEKYENYGNTKLFCIEKEPEFQAILRDKGYNFLDSDFLNYIPDCTFDAIIMNPPFDNGIKHFLHAWDISSNTHIRCLLNAEDITNPNTQDKKLLANIISDNNGTVEYLGNCFIDSERKTGVNVVMISIFKKQKDEDTYEFTKKFDQEKQYTLNDIDKNGVATNDVFGNLEVRFNKCRESLKKMIELKNEFEYYAQGIVDLNPMELLSKGNSDTGLFNNACDNIRKDAWKNIFQNTKLGNVVTTKAKDKIAKLQDQQGHMAFTANNMESLYSDLFQNMGNIMKDCIVESFDLLTKYHDENRCYVEGWKTNKRFHVNQKFILPRAVDSSWDSDYIHMEWRMKETLTDIEKAMCFLTGKKIENIKTIDQIFTDKETTTYGKWHDSEFFEYKCFKKGTMHFKFKSESLWKKFNITACEGKNWLGM